MVLGAIREVGDTVLGGEDLPLATSEAAAPIVVTVGVPAGAITGVPVLSSADAITSRIRAPAGAKNPRSNSISFHWSSTSLVDEKATNIMLSDNPEVECGVCGSNTTLLRERSNRAWPPDSCTMKSELTSSREPINATLVVDVSVCGLEPHDWLHCMEFQRNPSERRASL